MAAPSPPDASAPHPDPSVAVLGVGAIGSCVGADLSLAGVDTTLIDQWPANVEAMRSNGIRVVGDGGGYQAPKVSAHHLCDVASLRAEFDVVLLASKSQDTRWLAEFIAPYMRTDGVVVGLQNGMNDATVADVLGAERVLGCVLELSAEITAPGTVQRNTGPDRTWFGVGELSGVYTDRLDQIAKLLSLAGKVTVTDNVEGAKWTKLVNSAMILAPCGALGLQSYQALELPDAREFLATAGAEALLVGRAAGYRIEPIFGRTAAEFDRPDDEIVELLLYALRHDLGKASRSARGVVLQDFGKGRRSEVEFLSGVVSRTGREVGIPTPANDAVVEVCRRIDRGELRPNPANLHLLNQIARESHDVAR